MTTNKMWLGLEGHEQSITMMGRTFGVAPEEIVREQRAASGLLRVDIIAKKDIFTLSFELIENSTVEMFENLYALHEPLNFIYETVSGTYSATVRILPFSKERFTAVGVGLWSGATIELKEF